MQFGIHGRTVTAFGFLDTRCTSASSRRWRRSLDSELAPPRSGCRKCSPCRSTGRVLQEHLGKIRTAEQSRTLPDTLRGPLKPQPHVDVLNGSLTDSPILKQRASSNVPLISPAPRLLGRARTRAKSERESLVNFQDALSARAPGVR